MCNTFVRCPSILSWANESPRSRTGCASSELAWSTHSLKLCPIELGMLSSLWWTFWTSFWIWQWTTTPEQTMTRNTSGNAKKCSKEWQRLWCCLSGTFPDLNWHHAFTGSSTPQANWFLGGTTSGISGVSSLNGSWDGWRPSSRTAAWLCPIWYQALNTLTFSCMYTKTLTYLYLYTNNVCFALFCTQTLTHLHLWLNALTY